MRQLREGTELAISLITAFNHGTSFAEGVFER
jgi:hypothetical protein